jgi:hypothetical protein
MAKLQTNPIRPDAQRAGGVPDDILERLPPEPYPALRPQIRTGDLFLCSGDDPFSGLIRAATKSPWSHVAIALRLDEIDRVMVLEAVEKLGVRCVPLSLFLSQSSSGKKPYPGRILLARHHGFQARADPAAVNRMARYALDRLGAPFAGGDMIKIGLRIVAGFFAIKTPPMLVPDDEFICSEYAARCYEAAGVEIPWDGLGFIAPCDFAADPAVEAMAQVRTL